MRSKPAIIVSAAVSAAALVAGTAALGVFGMPAGMVDPASGGGTAVTQVEQTLLESYCAPRMALADTESYGDQQFAASTGDLASSGRYAAFGSFYASRLDTLDSLPEQSLPTASADGASALAYDQGAADDGKGMLLSTALLKADEGSGAAGATASWATEGDLRGLSAAPCVEPAMEQSFLIGSTVTGSSQQLLVANPSDKPTVISLTAWGTSQSGQMQLATNSQMTVQANSTMVVSLSSALPKQDAAYVTVTSEVTPVAALVRHTAADGLTPMGSEYVSAVAPEATASALAGVAKDDDVTVRLFAGKATGVTLSWMNAKGSKEAKKVDLPAGRVVSVPLGKAPSDAQAVLVDAGEAVTAALSADRAGEDGQHDFAVVQAAVPSRRSATAIPEGMRASVVVANAGDGTMSATLDCFDAKGAVVASKDVTVKAGSAVAFATGDLPEGTAAVRLDDDGAGLSWSVRLTSSTLDDAGVAGVAVLTPTSLQPRTVDVDSSSSRFVTAR